MSQDDTVELKAGEKSWWCCCATPEPHPEGSHYESEEDKQNNAASSLATQVSQGDQKQPVQYVQAPVPMQPLAQQWLLPDLAPNTPPKKCLVLDLDETLVHSSFTPIPNADFVIELDLNGTIHRVYVRKRPGVDEFMRFVGGRFEVVIFTASLAKYADPLLDKLDPLEVIDYRLFREHCVHFQGNYVKDLSKLGRPLKDCIIVDNSPYSYMFQRDYSIPCISWFTDTTDRQLYELMPFLEKLLVVDDVSTVLKKDRLTWSTMEFDEHV